MNALFRVPRAGKNFLQKFCASRESIFGKMILAQAFGHSRCGTT
jgi:hypothetical protein